MASLDEIFDFETPIEEAFKTLFVQAGLTAKTPSDEVNFEGDRPRVEVLFTVNGANDSRQFRCPDGLHRHDLYSGQLTLAIVTATRSQDDSLSTDHRSYRAKIRSVMSNVNGAQLNNIEIRYIIPGATTPKVEPQSGYEVSNIIYEIRFGVKQGAWPTPAS